MSTASKDVAEISSKAFIDRHFETCTRNSLVNEPSRGLYWIEYGCGNPGFWFQVTFNQLLLSSESDSMRAIFLSQSDNNSKVCRL